MPVPVHIVTPDPDFVELELPCVTMQLVDVRRDPARMDNERRVEVDPDAMTAEVRPPTQPYNLHFSIAPHTVDEVNNLCIPGVSSQAVGLEYDVTDGEQEILNPAGVNCIRAFRGRGIRVWGARTMSSEPSLRHIHKRRFLMFVEESIAESTQWIVHEPNDQRLWGKIVRSISSFLRRQWLEGALFGASENEAYYVKCDEETNPLEIAQWSGGRRISE